MLKRNSEVCPTFFTCVWFYYFNFERNYDVLKLKSPYILLNKNIDFNKNETELKMENPAHSFRETTISFSSYKNGKLKVELWWVGAPERKKRAFFVSFILSKGNFFNIWNFFNTPQCIVYWIHFQNIHTFTYQKTLHHTLLLLAFKIVESLQCILKGFKVTKFIKKFEFEEAWGMFRQKTVFRENLGQKIWEEL